jgi:outer membrane receptor protein involved in Fe transport
MRVRASRKFRNICAASVIVMALPAEAWADQVSVDQTPITVLGRQLDQPKSAPAYGQSIITRKQLASEASGRVENALRDVAGFSQFRRSDSRSANPSAQGANLRALGGNAASRTLVLLDGVPLADPFFGYIPYAAIAPDSLSRITVIRGGGTGAFGAGAVAGTIDMASATRADLAPIAASALYGSRNAQELSASVSPDLGAGFVSLSGRYERGDGFFTTPLAERASASVAARYESWSAGLRAVAPIGDSSELQTRFLIYRDNRVLRFAGANSGSEAQDASIRLISRGAWQVDALAYVQARNFSNVVISGTTFRKTLDQRNTPALGLGGKVEVRPPVGGGHALRFGIDARQNAGDMFEDAYNAGIASNPLTARRHAFGRQTTAGVFFEDDWTLGNLVLTAGARLDKWSIRDGFLRSQTATGLQTADIVYPARSGWEVGGRAGAVWTVHPVFALRAAAYTDFRLPTLNELYRSFTVFPVTTNANPDLRPERLRGAEIGFDFTPAPSMSLNATVFDNRLENAIGNVTAAPNIRQRQNLTAIEARGIELGASLKSGNFALNGSYAHTVSRVSAPGNALDGLAPAQTARDAGSATLSWQRRGGALLSGSVRYTGPQFEDDLNIDRLPAALTVDAFGRIPLFAGVSLIARVENIFDATIVTRRVSTPTLSQDIGVPRTVWIGLAFGLGQ